MSLRLTNRGSRRAKSSEEASTAGSGNEVVSEDKLIQLEKKLNKFRAEVDIKMSIIEQILKTRTEMFTIHKKLLEREQALHETVLSHWKNVPELAATGHSLMFGDNSNNDIEQVMFAEDVDENSSVRHGKRQASAATLARRARKKRIKSQISIDESVSEADINLPDQDTHTFNEAETDRQNDGPAENEDSSERRVYVNYYSEEPPKPGEIVTNTPVWKYFLREENGLTALCKICDAAGVQYFLKASRGTSLLHRHLRRRHSSEVVLPEQTSEDENSNFAGDSNDGPGEYNSNELQEAKAKPWLYGGHGRLRDKVWSFFSMGPLKSGQKRPVMICDFCDNEVSPEAPRLRKHLQKCDTFQEQSEGKYY